MTTTETGSAKRTREHLKKAAHHYRLASHNYRDAAHKEADGDEREADHLIRDGAAHAVHALEHADAAARQHAAAVVACGCSHANDGGSPSVDG